MLRKAHDCENTILGDDCGPKFNKIRLDEKKEETTEPVVGFEINQRTIFAYQLPISADKKLISDFFSPAGTVQDVQLITDRHSECNKKAAFIMFKDLNSVLVAMQKSGEDFMGSRVSVRRATPEPMVDAAVDAAVDRTLFVRCLHINLSDQQLQKLFEWFGPTELVHVPFNTRTGHGTGLATVRFTEAANAKKAATSLHQLYEMSGQYIEVSSTPFPPDEEILCFGDPEPPSEYMMLSNVFDPAMGLSPKTSLFVQNFVELEDNVRKLCERYGDIEHVYLDRNSPGHVYVHANSKKVAAFLQKGMHMRHFEERLISCVYLQRKAYEAKCGVTP